MFRFLSASKRPVSRSRASFRPQLEVLEERALLSATARGTPPVGFSLSGNPVARASISSSVRALETGLPVGFGSSPTLHWSNPPDATQSFALIETDTTVKGEFPPNGFVHWVLFDIPAGTSMLPSGAGNKPALLPTGTMQGNNGNGEPGYVGPSPSKPGPNDTSPRQIDFEAHTYVITLYALNTAQLPLAAGADEQQVLTAMGGPAPQGHILGQTSISGTFRIPGV
jgi:Raf kinase inhibitor-like YbhB/YbcL family protein